MNGNAAKTSVRRLDLLQYVGALPLNCKKEGGAVTPALEAREAVAGEAQEELSLLGYSPAAKGFFVCGGGRIYFSVKGNSLVDCGAFDGEKGFLTDVTNMSEKYGFAACASCAYKKFPNGTIRGAQGLALETAAFRCGRLFGVSPSDGNLLKWSGEGGAEDWIDGISGAGYVYLSERLGKILSLHDFSDRLVIMRERGISLLSAYGAPENFKLEDACECPSAIAGTAAEVGGKLFFCTEDGMYSFDGSKISLCDHALAGDMTSPVSAFGADGRYYFAAAYSAALSRKVLYRYDVFSKDMCLVDVSISSGAYGGGTALMSSGNRLYTLQKAEKYQYICKDIDFGTVKRKALTYIDLDGEADIEITDGRNVRVIAGARGRVRADMSGVKFDVSLKGGGKVSALTAYAEVTDDF